jgi:aspartokinase/homoserine dehydrogenase 1
MILLKFGGSSVADAKRIKQIAKIIDDYKNQKNLVIVVSALQGVTNLLEESGTHAVNGSAEFIGTLKTIESRHFEIINELVDSKNRTEIAAQIKMLCNEAEEICQGISILGEYSQRSKAKLLSLGERMSSGVISASLNNLGHTNKLINAQELLVTDDNCG